MNRKILLLAIAALASFRGIAAETPRLIVQIVVGSMRAEDLARYAENFGEGGFRPHHAGRHGLYGQPLRLPADHHARLAGHARDRGMPSTHGVIGSQWVDYTSNAVVGLTDGRKGPGAYHLIAPTLAETLRQHAPAAIRSRSPPKPCRPW